jgi:gliding motility-associated-like protein
LIRLNKIFTYLVLILTCTTSSAVLYAQMEFVQNKGQWNDKVNYRGDFKTGSFFLENKGFTVLLYKPEDVQLLSERIHGHGAGDGKSVINNDPIVFHSFAYKVNFLGAARNVQGVADKILPAKNNYFLGNDHAKWASGCSVAQSVNYSNIYPGIDLHYYSDAGKLKYDFIIHPGADVSSIRLHYDGPILMIKDKELIIETPVGIVKELYPYSYQPGTGKRKPVECYYRLKDNVVSFEVKDYDKKETLVIDPSVIFSSFTGSTADNWGYTATPGKDGSFYAGGIVFGTGYPVSPGAYQTTYGGGTNEDSFSGYDMAIFKFSPDGSSRRYATYLGGNGNEQPHSMIEDAQGNLIIAGRTNSTNFPQVGGGSRPGLAFDICISKLNSTGSILLGSVKMGGAADDGVNIRPKYRSPSGADRIRRNYGDDARSEVILDGANNIYLASCTQSSNFPLQAAIQGTYKDGGQDGVIIKFNSTLSTLLFSTFFGGSGADACFVASISPTTGNLYIAGGTMSDNLPGITTGTIKPALTAGEIDGFVTILKNDGSAILRTTYYGTELSSDRSKSIDIIYGLKFDRLGIPYIMGTTTGIMNPINATFSNPGAKQFIAKLQPDLSSNIYLTTFGNNSTLPSISPIAFLVDRCQNVYVSGWGGGINIDHGYTTANTNGLPEVSPLSGIPPADGADFYFFVMEKNATRQLFGSHFGQFGGLGDHVDGGTSRFDDNGIIYQAICANCSGGANFPTTPGAWAASNGSNNCNEAAVKIEMNFAGVGATLQASINAVVNDTTGCIPLTVDFKDTLQKGKKYYWNFGDGALDTTAAATNSHVYNAIGTTVVMLIAEDSATCNIRDTAYVTIRAGDNKATLDFIPQKLLPCESLTMQYTNISTSVAGSFGPRSFYWDYGDGSPRDTAGLTPPRVHTYASAGTYIVTLFLQDTSFCNSPVSVQKTIRLSPIVEAKFITPPLGCAPYTANFENTSLAGTDFLWEFGDNSTSTIVSPTHDYPNPGTYNVRLIASDTSTCNKIDTSDYFTITVVAKPIASFTWAPNPPQENVPVQFTNLSQGATHYLWNFGDGENSTEVNPKHEYNATGKYAAELIAYNEAECTDTFTLDVDVIIIPLLDVPNAFTPGRFGANGVVYVKGFGIGKMSWKIYNRWGQLMFETANRKLGWNGYYKGKLQPMDVYAYTLDVEFTDGKKLRKTGDITLLR